MFGMSRHERPDDDALAGEYVLGLLDGAERASVELRLGREGPLQAKVAFWRDRFSELDATARPQQAPAQLWGRIERAISDRLAMRAEPRPRLTESLWSSLGFWRGASFAGAAASLVLAVAVGLLAGRATPRPMVIAVLQAGDATPGAIIEAFHDGRIAVVPLRDIEVPPGRALEVWTLFDQARGPVSLGLIERARRAQFSTASLPARENQLYEITLEPATGSPIGRPTGPVLMKGFAVTPR
jgi:anti-sigma-K factor RskA